MKKLIIYFLFICFSMVTMTTHHNSMKIGYLYEYSVELDEDVKKENYLVVFDLEISLLNRVLAMQEEQYRENGYEQVFLDIPTPPPESV